MVRPQLLVIAASLMLANLVHAAPQDAAVNAPVATIDASNPLLKPSPLPFHFPQFDKIHNEDFMPAFNEGMKVHLREIEAIANNPKPATFDNTIVAMERAGELLGRTSTIFGNLSGANTNDGMQAIQRELSPKMAAHRDAVMLNEKLFKRVQSLYDKRDKLGLDAEAKHLVERYHSDFIHAGANLSAADKDKLKGYNSELAKLQTKFNQNVLKEINASGLVVDTRAELDGMSVAEIDAAAAAATKKGMPGKFLIPLVNTTGQAPLGVLTNRAVRLRMMDLSLARGSHGGEFDNRDVVQQIVKLRADKAILLGFPNFAAYSLEDQTAKNTTAVNSLLAQIAKPGVANAKREAADLQAIVDAEHGGFQIGAADWAFYTEKLRAQRFHFDENQVKPYFELNNVLTNGLFFAANKLYGITFKERKDFPVYDPDVRVFEVFDNNGKHLAIFMEDFYARSNKGGGAWMNQYVSQSSLKGEQPVVANHLNIPKPAAGQPTLMTFDEVNTMFHEFGHALHGMFSNVKYPRFSGTSVPRDFVEYPSQFNEMWALWPEVLQNYAKNYQTGAPMPKDLLDKVMAVKKFNQGYATTELLEAMLLDQSWHQLTPDQVPTDVLAFEASALKNAGVEFAPVPPRYRSTYFSHVFGSGYAAGYYSYLWSENLAADSGEWFKENGGLTRKNGDWFRAHILSRGGSDDALELYRKFRGRDAVIGPLLERRGLTAQ